MSKYSGAETIASLAFILFVLSFTVLRCIYYPFWVLRSTRFVLNHFPIYIWFSFCHLLKFLKYTFKGRLSACLLHYRFRKKKKSIILKNKHAFSHKIKFHLKLILWFGLKVTPRAVHCSYIIFLLFCSYEVVVALKSEMSWAEATIYYYVFNSLLFCLLVLNIFWWVLMLRMLVGQIRARGKVSEDIRSGKLKDFVTYTAF
jgi:hypothetical protein